MRMLPSIPFSLSALLAAIPAAAAPPPESLLLDDVPMIRQRANYCVPAAAAMIAAYHGVDTDQEEIARLSSAGSEGHQGTYPSDMALAMRKLGFVTRSRTWEVDEDEVGAFLAEQLPRIRAALAEHGPVYVSYRAGVFGSSGHGCVIVGYDDRRTRFTLHNPWGNEFHDDYADFAVKTRGVVEVLSLPQAETADADYTAAIREALPAAPTSLGELVGRLDAAGVTHLLRLANRRDERDERRFAEQTARREGRKILDLAFSRSRAVLLPRCEDGEITGYYYVRQPEAGASVDTRLIDADGWGPEEKRTIGRLARTWTTFIRNADGNGTNIWELPLIELRP